MSNLTLAMILYIEYGSEKNKASLCCNIRTQTILLIVLFVFSPMNNAADCVNLYPRKFSAVYITVLPYRL